MGLIRQTIQSVIPAGRIRAANPGADRLAAQPALRSRRNELARLFLSSFAVLFIGFGLFPLLPLYAGQLGASQGQVGIYLAGISLSNALGVLSVGWLAGRIERRRLFVAASSIGMLALGLLSQAQNLWQAALLTAAVWFSGGVILTLVNVYAGLLVAPGERDRVFGLMALSVPFGSLAGGAVISLVLARSGYPLMFLVLSAVWLAIPLLGLGLPHNRTSAPPEAASPKAGQAAPPTGLQGGYGWLLLIMLLSSMAISISRMGVPLRMQVQDFARTQVASSATVSGLAAVPLILAVGWAAGRLGARRVLVAVNFLVAVGVLVLGSAASLWHYWLTATLMMVGFSANGALMAALAVEVSGPGRLNRGLSWLGSTGSAASIISFGGVGVLLEQYGERAVYALATGLALMAALWLIAQPGRQPQARRQACRRRFFTFKRTCYQLDIKNWIACRFRPQDAGAPCA